ncbi:MAG: hypothetical protein MJZ12_00205 [Prevotella sp.]|nr:hypothetical protein [Prevotella sp.]
MRLNKAKGVSFNEFLHEYYTEDGTILIGVTGLLHKHNLAPDMSAIPQDVLNKAAERGTAIHAMLEDYDNGKAVVEDENIKAYKELNLQVNRSEYMVSDGKTVATFIDKVLDDCSLVDVKTWASVDSERKRYVTWQQSVCAYLFELQNPSKKVPHIYMARVRDGKAELVELNRIPDDCVKALIEAEKNGEIYEDNSIPDAGIVLQEDGVTILAQTLTTIAEYTAYVEALEDKAKVLKEKLYDYMIENKLDEMKCDAGRFYIKAGYTRISIDTNRLKTEKPDIYQGYIKKTEIKSSLTFKAI